MEFLEVITTADTQELAERISDALVGAGLAACVQVSGPVTSTYRWKGRIERDKEWIVTIKTEKSLYDAVEAKIKELHTYEVPQIIALTIHTGSKEYLEWLKESITSDE